MCTNQPDQNLNNKKCSYLYIYTVEYYLPMKRNEGLICDTV